MKTSIAERGFTLIELLIGLVLGMIATLAIFATLSSFESQRRTTGTGVDMQQNGLLALYSLEQDIRMAGFGLIDASKKSLPCRKINAYLGGSNSVFNGAPLVIEPDAVVGNDIIAINRLNSDTGGIVTGGEAAKVTIPFAAVGDITVDTSIAIRANDFLLAAQPGLDCTLLKASVAPPDPTHVTVAAAGNAGGVASGVPAFPSYGTAGSAVLINLGPNAASAPTATILGSIADSSLNPRFVTTRYRIQRNVANNSFELQRSADNWNTNSVVAANIVNVSAQYGIADAPPGGGGCATTPAIGVVCASQKVTHWVDTAGNDSAGTNWLDPSTEAGIKRIKAIRIAIVARSAQKADCATTASAPIWFDNPAIDLETVTGSADWTCYRYKVYQTVIPLRNVIWGNFQ